MCGALFRKLTMGAGGSAEREVTIEEEDGDEPAAPSIKVSLSVEEFRSSSLPPKGDGGFRKARVQHDHGQR